MVYLGTLKGMSTRDARQRSMDLLERLDLAEKSQDKVKEFSKGMQQKVQFAVTILHQPELIIVDEPFSGLDPVNTLTIKGMIQDLRDQGTAIVMSTHQMYQVEEMADRLMMINRGTSGTLWDCRSDVRQRFARCMRLSSKVQGDWHALPGVVRVLNGRTTAGMVSFSIWKMNVTSDQVLA